MSQSPRSSSGFGVRNNTFAALLLTSILAHGILFARRSIEPFQASQRASDDATFFTQQRGRSSRSQKQEKLPHWRLATDCSSYSFDCHAAAQIGDKYLPYPFPLSLRENAEAFFVSNNTSTKSKQLRDEWSAERFDRIPDEWINYLERNESKTPVKDRNYLYPPEVSTKDYETCIDFAIKQNKNTWEQIDIMLSGESPRLVPEPNTNMVAFTISDYNYVHDMLHDMFQMMDNIVGFSPKHFFLVAIDELTVEMACKYGYPVVFWKEDGDLKDAVANTKLVLSYFLVKKGINFFFTEMDVWWIRSPIPNLVDFQKKHKVLDGDRKHLYFSGHQNNPTAANIGVYAVMANKYTEEYFRVCLSTLKEKPETHDQFVMQEVYRLFRENYYGKTNYTLKGRFLPEGDPPKTPKVENPFTPVYFSAHEIAADERPTVTTETLAIHTLCNKPLRAPHGKKMKAKELGVWYGFHSHSGAMSDANAAGYYDRSGKNRRYLWLDTEIRNNFFSVVHNERYHNILSFQWTMAILMAIARKTNRILVFPEVFNADMDAGTYFVWPLMDYSNVTDMVDFRETAFLNNPKAWRNGGASPDNWPFESVVNTGLFQAVDEEENHISIYTQVSSQSSILSKKLWTANLQSHELLDAWIGSLSSVPELDSAEVLLVNPEMFMKNSQLNRFRGRLKNREKMIAEKGEDYFYVPPIGRFEREALEIYNLLGWCLVRRNGRLIYGHTANKVSASNSCFGTGERSDI